VRAVAVRVLIADDNEQVRSAISDIIRDEGLEVCGSFADGKTAVDKAAELKPDMVILDFQMPQRDGISAGRAIHAFLPNVPLLLYTMFATVPSLENEAKKLGFQAVVQKGDTAGLIAAIRGAVPH
jgi:DNA-binding NarL/FixJ family response regulator